MVERLKGFIIMNVGFDRPQRQGFYGKQNNNGRCEMSRDHEGLEGRPRVFCGSSPAAVLC